MSVLINGDVALLDMQLEGDVFITRLAEQNKNILEGKAMCVQVLGGRSTLI